MIIDFILTDSSKFLVNYIENKDQHHPWVIDFDVIEGNIQCNYIKYDTMGLLCSHCLRVLRQLDIVKILEEYLLL
ncbi:hypothetical protein MA16_Dca017969 [Dendrobium catenatum]|uniref:SWIM-type domain-containing protein n=1 Tax=Dendrobium catenatum TaxID=906689 RepID=A0A2I0W271_9ASPA|nr:hypothetical protein MA16_Dca017969 [Dendrobium catenatum]